MSVAMWIFILGPLDVSSNEKLLFMTTRCQYQCGITILGPLDVSSNSEIAIIDN